MTGEENPITHAAPGRGPVLKIATLQDMRDAIQKLADVNRVSVTTLNNMSGASGGLLRRFLRVVDRRRINGVLVDETYETDIKFSVLLKAIDAAGYEMQLRPKSSAPRRERVREVQRQARNGEAPEEVAPQ